MIRRIRVNLVGDLLIDDKQNETIMLSCSFFLFRLSSDFFFSHSNKSIVYFTAVAQSFLIRRRRFS
jgi:hypothetical protein